jgi:hypothetical protein
VLAGAEQGFSQIIFHKPQLVAAAVYMTLIQSSLELAMLMRRPTVTAGGVLRSIFESYADLRALIIDLNYSRRMLATFYEQKLRLCQNMIENPDNPYHADLAGRLDPVAEIAKVAPLLEEQAKVGVRPLGNFDRLKAAGLEYEYRSLYWQLCLESHNSISAIEARHIEQTPRGVSLEFRKPNRPGELLKYYDSLVSVVIDSTQRIHQWSGSPISKDWQAWRDRLTAFRQRNHGSAMGSQESVF